MGGCSAAATTIRDTRVLKTDSVTSDVSSQSPASRISCDSRLIDAEATQTDKYWCEASGYGYGRSRTRRWLARWVDWRKIDVSHSRILGRVET